MRLSNVYSGMQLWAMVYHTQPGSSEVELVAPRFFKSEKKAWRWFNRKYIIASFVEPEAVIDRKSTRLNSSHLGISYAVVCLEKQEHGANECDQCHEGTHALACRAHVRTV